VSFPTRKQEEDMTNDWFALPKQSSQIIFDPTPGAYALRVESKMLASTV